MINNINTSSNQDKVKLCVFNNKVTFFDKTERVIVTAADIYEFDLIADAEAKVNELGLSESLSSYKQHQAKIAEAREKINKTRTNGNN